jgi:23S rRNA (adenine2503-C2)-methyltransferase
MLSALRPAGSASHLLGALHRVGRWTRTDDGRAVPPLGRRARDFVASHFDLTLPEIVAQHTSDDGATKLVLALADGARIEAVHMPRAVRNPRVTLCISSQVGCAMGCRFCRTAQMGLVRNLDAHEIVGQVLAVLLALGPADPGRVSLVFMGMGEPLHNTAAVLRAIEVLCQPDGLGLAPLRVTVSTSGLVAGIDAIARAPVRPALAVSINATTDAMRRDLMPVAARHDLAELMAALHRHPLRAHEKITFEYVLLGGCNDTDDDADRLAALASGLRHNLNLIPWNPTGSDDFARPTEARTASFAQRLRARGCLVTVRRTRGRDISGACGLLATPSVRARRGARPDVAGEDTA